MAASYPVGINRVIGETLALSTTIASLGVPTNAYQVVVYDPSVDFRLKVNPKITDVRFYDASNSANARYEAGTGTTGSLLSDLTDRDTGTGTGTALDSSTTSDYLYLCTTDVVGGFHFVIGSANGTAATTLVVEYRKNDDTWAALTVTDGTASGGIALAQTGAATWTAPTDAKPCQLGGSGGIVTDTDAPGTVGFWWRVSWDEALDSDTEIDEIWTLNKNTDRGYFRAGVEYPMSLDLRTVGAIEAILAAGTDTMQVTWLRVAGV